MTTPQSRKDVELAFSDLMFAVHDRQDPRLIARIRKELNRRLDVWIGSGNNDASAEPSDGTRRSESVKKEI